MRLLSSRELSCYSYRYFCHTAVQSLTEAHRAEPALWRTAAITNSVSSGGSTLALGRIISVKSQPHLGVSIKLYIYILH